jgi:hypothetical protein
VRESVSKAKQLLQLPCLPALAPLSGTVSPVNPEGGGSGGQAEGAMRGLQVTCMSCRCWSFSRDYNRVEGEDGHEKGG